MTYKIDDEVYCINDSLSVYLKKGIIKNVTSDLYSVEFKVKTGWSHGCRGATKTEYGVFLYETDITSSKSDCLKLALDKSKGEQCYE